MNINVDPSLFKINNNIFRRQDILHVWEFPIDDPRRLKNPNYPFTISGARKMLNYISIKIKNQIISSCNGIVDEGLDKFRTAEDAQEFVNIIDEFNKTIECVINQYFIDNEIKQQLDEIALPHLIMKKITEE